VTPGIRSWWGIQLTRGFPLRSGSDNLILMPDISATEAARRFADVLDKVEHGKESYTIVRRGKAVAHLEPVSRGRGADVKVLIRRHRPDPSWSEDLDRLRELIEIDHRP